MLAIARNHQIVLNSMHKYQPRIHLVLWRGKESQNLANAPVKALEKEAYRTFIFKETIFTAVTAYQNHSVSFGPRGGLFFELSALAFALASQPTDSLANLFLQSSLSRSPNSRSTRTRSRRDSATPPD